MTRCLAPDCAMGGLGCDNMTVILVCFLNGQSYDKLAERCAISTHTIRSRSYSTGSSESSCSTSCSTTTPELSDEDSPKFQKKSSQAKKSPSGKVNVSVPEELNEIKSSPVEASEPLK